VKLLLPAWFLFIASASFWLPGYKGNIELGVDGAAAATAAYACVAALAAVGVRGRVQSGRDAPLSALPAVALLAAAALAGYLLNKQRAEFRGEPIFLFFGVALWASWAALVLSTAFVSRTRWNGVAGIVVGSLVAALGLFAFTIRID
jgi:hypothetical protein